MSSASSIFDLEPQARFGRKLTSIGDFGVTIDVWGGSSRKKIVSRRLILILGIVNIDVCFCLLTFVDFGLWEDVFVSLTLGVVDVLGGDISQVLI